MAKENRKKQSFDFIGYIFTFLIALVVFRVMVLAIDVDYFRDEYGRQSAFGECIKIFQTVVDNITKPIINPFRDFIFKTVDGADLELLNILAPVFIIIVLTLLNLIIKLVMPYIVSCIIKDKKD